MLCIVTGAEGGSRTHMKLPSRDFESRASAIPPLRHIKLSFAIWNGRRTVCTRRNKVSSQRLNDAYCRKCDNQFYVSKIILMSYPPLRHFLIATALFYHKKSFLASVLHKFM